MKVVLRNVHPKTLNVCLLKGLCVAGQREVELQQFVTNFDPFRGPRRRQVAGQLLHQGELSNKGLGGISFSL